MRIGKEVLSTLLAKAGPLRLLKKMLESVPAVIYRH